MTTGMGRVARFALHSYFLLLVLFLYLPLVVLVIFAFNDNALPTLPLSGFTTHWFSQAFSNSDLTGSARRSLELRDLGASEIWAFTLVTLPLLAPALVSSFLIAFTISFDEFAIASFLAPGGSPTFPVFVYTGARTPLLQPEVIAIGSLVVIASLVL